MTAKVFVDSNILIYAHDRDAGAKNRRAATHLMALWESGAGCLRTQVLEEFYVNVTRKIGCPLSASVAREVIRNYALWDTSPITAVTVIRASEISETWRLSFWDGMVVASAEQNRAAELLTEDLSHGQLIAGVKIRNPFIED